jgi:hypothetical protein
LGGLGSYGSIYGSGLNHAGLYGSGIIGGNALIKRF